MAAHVYRYKYNGPRQQDISAAVPGAIVVGTLSPPPYFDVTADDTALADLSEFMATQGFSYVATDPATTTAQASSSDAAAIRTLEKFISAPAEGWPSGVYRAVTGSPFPSTIIWWTSSAMTTKIVEVTYTRNGAQQATSVQWKLYAADGTTVLATVTDAITYTSGMEATRTRTIA